MEATATATNGGLVLASAGPSLLVGVRPSVDLTFTPLISTSNGGRSWSDGLVAKQLAARPDALATFSGHALALVNSSVGGQVLADVGGISKWRALVTKGGLARARAGKSCGLGSLTSVGYLGARPLIGGNCVHAGVVGLFANAHGIWRLAGPTLPSSLDNGSGRSPRPVDLAENDRGHGRGYRCQWDRRLGGLVTARRGLGHLGPIDHW